MHLRSHLSHPRAHVHARRKGAAEEEKAHGAVGLTQVNANINNEHWSRDDKYRGNHPSTYDTRGSMEGKKSVAELSSDPSVCC